MIKFTPTPQQITDVAVLTYKGHTQASIMVHTGLSLEEVRACQVQSITNPFDKHKKRNSTIYDIEKTERELWELLVKMQNQQLSFKEIDRYTTLKHVYAHALI